MGEKTGEHRPYQAIRHWNHGLRHWLSRSRSEEGQSVVEFAIVSLVFIFLVLAILDFGHLCFVQVEVQDALQEAARYGSTGNHLPNPASPGTTLSRVVSITDIFQQNVIGVQTSNIQVSSLSGGATSAGGPGDMLTVSATVGMPLWTPLIARIFPKGEYTFTTSTTIMNEPFPPSETN
jgi:Flp pilus assembly protein TadG